LGLKNGICRVRLSALYGLNDSLDGETLSNELTRLLRVTKGGKINPDLSVHCLKLLSSGARLGTGLASRGLASLGCSFILTGWKPIEIKPETFVVNDVLLHLLNVSTA
jgi:hypothetical protein